MRGFRRWECKRYKYENISIIYLLFCSYIINIITVIILRNLSTISRLHANLNTYLGVLHHGVARFPVNFDHIMIMLYVFNKIASMLLNQKLENRNTLKFSFR